MTTIDRRGFLATVVAAPFVPALTRLSGLYPLYYARGTNEVIFLVGKSGPTIRISAARLFGAAYKDLPPIASSSARTAKGVGVR